MKKTKGTARGDLQDRLARQPETTNRLSPSGGVMKPTPSAVIIMTQNWISFMPILSAKRLQDRREDHDVRRRLHHAARRDQDPIIIRISIAGSRSST
jgi:hypothetical protein